MKKKDVINGLTPSFLDEIGLLFFFEGKGQFSGPLKSSNFISIDFKVKNEPSLVCSFVEYENWAGIYLEIWWYQRPGAKMICFTDKLCSSLSELADQKETIKNAVELSQKIYSNYMKRR